MGGYYDYGYGAATPSGSAGAFGAITILLILFAAASYIIPPIVCAVKAQEKARSVGWWVFGGMMLGWIGMIIILCLPSLRSHKPSGAHRPFYTSSRDGADTSTSGNETYTVPTRVRAKVEKYRCAECGEMIDTEQCPWCGARRK